MAEIPAREREEGSPARRLIRATVERRPLVRAARRAGPWLLAAAIVGYLFSRVPLAEAYRVARDAQLEVFVPLVAIAVVAWFLIDAYLYAFLFTRWNAPLSFREARALRGMSYLLTPIHWNVGKAAVILRLRQTKGIPVLESTSSLLLYQSVDGLILASFATAGLTLLARDAVALGNARVATIAVVLVILANLVLLRATRPTFRWLVWWRGLSIHHAQRRYELSDLVRIATIKGAYHLGFVLVYYYGASAFGIELPLALVLAAAPIIQAVGALPITPAGLGTQQAAMLYFFAGPFGGNGSEAAIVAFGFSLPIALIVARCLLGLVYLGDLARRDAVGTSQPARPAPSSGAPMTSEAVEAVEDARDLGQPIERPRS